MLQQGNISYFNFIILFIFFYGLTFLFNNDNNINTALLHCFCVMEMHFSGVEIVSIFFLFFLFFFVFFYKMVN